MLIKDPLLHLDPNNIEVVLNILNNQRSKLILLNMQIKIQDLIIKDLKELRIHQVNQINMDHQILLSHKDIIHLHNQTMALQQQ